MTTSLFCNSQLPHLEVSVSRYKISNIAFSHQEEYGSKRTSVVLPRARTAAGNPRFEIAVISFKSPNPPRNPCLIAYLGNKRMNTLTKTNTNIIRRGFTLIEILIVVVILGILAAVVVPQFSNAADDANDAAVRSQLQTLRGQIELYRAQNSGDPDLTGTGWTDMIDGNYLMSNPSNPLTSSATVAGSAAAGVGWVWRDKSATNTTKGLYAVSADGAEFSE